VRSLKRVLAVAVPVVVLALTPAATVAGGPSVFGKGTTTVSIKSAALAPGGAVVTIKYSCFPVGYGPYGTFGYTQVGDVHGDQGFSFFKPSCNDRWQTQGIFVPGAFRPGDAAVTATVCGFDCNFDTREVKLR